MPISLFIAIMLAVFCADQASKWWIVQHFTLYESREIVAGFFHLTYLTNNGAAFSILAGQPALWRQIFFVSINCLALVAIFIGQQRFGRTSKLYSLALALIAGGAAGNLIDRLRLGHVVDFLDFHLAGYHWPAFNIADAAINIGVFLFLLNSLLLEPRQRRSC